MMILANNAARYSYYDTKGNKPFPIELIFAIVFFSLMMGFRYEVGEDYPNYYESYKYGDFLERFEYLFLFLSYTCYNLHLPVWVYFSILAFLQICFFTLYFRDELYVLPLIFLLLFVEGSYLFWLNGIRQAIALCIWLYAVRFIEKKELSKYLLFTAIAFGFHKSVIYLLLVYPLLKEGKDYFKNNYIQLFLLVVAIVVRLSFSNYLDSIEKLALFAQDTVNMGDYAVKLSDDVAREASGTGLAWLFYTFCYILVVCYSKRLKSFYKGNRFIIIYSLFFVGLFINICLPANSVILSRPFRYLYIFQPIVISYFCYYLQRIGRNERLLSYLILVGYIGAFYLNQITATEDSHIWFKFL